MCADSAWHDLTKELTMKTKTFQMTFGQQYSHEVHPTHRWVHPDGYATLVVPADTDPHTAAYRIFGDRYSWIYPEDQFENSKHYYPRGCLQRIDA